MTKIRYALVVALVVLTAIVGLQSSQAQAYPGSQNSLLPNYSYTAQVFTANSSTGATVNVGGLRSGLIQVTGSSLTTATWKIQGSADGGVTWTDLPTAAYPTTVVPITTTAVSQTSTAAGLFCVNLSGMTNVRFATTSGTFTATSLSLKLTASSNGGYL
jgi:hypothetical protein